MDGEETTCVPFKAAADAAAAAAAAAVAAFSIGEEGGLSCC